MQEDLEVLKRALIAADMRPRRGRRAAARRPRRRPDRGSSRRAWPWPCSTSGEMWKRGEVFLPEVVASAEVFKAVQRDRRAGAAREEGPERRGQRARAARHREGRPARPRQEHGRARCCARAGSTCTTSARTSAPTRSSPRSRRCTRRSSGSPRCSPRPFPIRRPSIKKLVAAGLRDQVIVMVGGAPVTPEWAEKIGADGYANNAPEAVEIAKKLVGACPVSGVAPSTTVLSGPGARYASATSIRSSSSASASTRPAARGSPSELKAGDMTTVQADAVAQVEAGAAVLDLNAGIPGFDEAAMLSAGRAGGARGRRRAAVHRLVDARGARGGRARSPRARC